METEQQIGCGKVILENTVYSVLLDDGTVRHGIYRALVDRECGCFVFGTHRSLCDECILKYEW